MGFMTETMRQRAEEFVRNWTGRGDEDSDTQQYWIDLLENVIQVPDVRDRDVAWFERRTASGGKIDLYCGEARFLVEQKSLGVDLDKPAERQHRMVTPVQQALSYANALPASQRPDRIIVCPFDRFRIYNLETDPLCERPAAEFTLDELPANIGLLAGLFDLNRSRVTIQKRLSREAGVLAARLHDALAVCYPADDPAAHDALAMLTVRIVFCLYAEDAGLFGRPGRFTAYVEASYGRHLQGDLRDLFRVLDTPDAERGYLGDELKAFPYVDGGLFEADTPIPPLNDAVREAIVGIATGFDWSTISPVIFGSLMEETLSHDERRSGGMHYTSPENIHRLIDPLFLDGLKADLADAEARPLTGGARTKALNALHDRIAALRFLDPACGSGNFLTETFLCLRRLENRIIGDLDNDGQLQLDLGDGDGPVRVTIDRFHGIEINGFACAVARTALWIAEQQMLADTESIITSTLPRLPFRDTAHIVRANALRYDWNTLLPAGECDYVMGNPPFAGHITKSPEQNADLESVWGKGCDGYLDYVTGWFRKAADYLAPNADASFAFVATNSITQGRPVQALFKPLFDEGWRISFAHRSFEWSAPSTENAQVHVVIIGMDRKDYPLPVLYRYDRVDGEPRPTPVDNINGYLAPGSDLFLKARSQSKGTLAPDLSTVHYGSMPLDGGSLLITTREEYERGMSDPIAARYIRPFLMGKQFINGIRNWCLWLVDAEPQEMRESHFISERVRMCREDREHSRPGTDKYKHRNTPWLFRDDHQPREPYLAIPEVFTRRRRYATCGFCPPNVIAGSKIYVCEDPDLVNFSIIESSMFITWQMSIGGKNKSDPSFANTIVWNTLPLPRMDDALRRSVCEKGRGVLDARAAHPGQSLADLYDPDFMPPDLADAHRELDKIVDVAFGAGKWLGEDNEARMQVLYDRYTEMTGMGR